MQKAHARKSRAGRHSQIAANRLQRKQTCKYERVVHRTELTWRRRRLTAVGASDVAGCVQTTPATTLAAPAAVRLRHYCRRLAAMRGNTWLVTCEQEIHKNNNR
eukprot:6214827-Pleurochrysis_carterae.AAC.12